MVRRFAPKRWFAGRLGYSEFGQKNVIDILRYENGEPCIYPHGFDPTFHKYRLEEPTKIKKPQNTFVCSMADLFGEWVPDEWIEEVFEACGKAPQHRYLFLTKNPGRYIKLEGKEILPKGNNFWYGSTIVNEISEYFYSGSHNTFISIEPISGAFQKCLILEAKWVIVGAETGNRKGRTIPKREWIEGVLENCRKHGVPIFMKNNLLDIWQEALMQDYPWRKEST